MNNRDILFKNGGEYREINILTDTNIDVNTTLKSQVQENLGDFATYQYIGEGATTITLSLYFANQQEFNDLKSFVIGEQLTLRRQNFTDQIVNCTGSISQSQTSHGQITATFEFTTARDGTEMDDFNFTFVAQDVSSSTTFLSKLQGASAKIFSFVGNVNEKIGNFTGKIGIVADSIANIGLAIASANTILTTPSSQIKNSTSSVTGAISSITQALQNVIFVIKSTPSDISAIFIGITSAMKSVFTVFSSDDDDEQARMNANFGSSVIDIIIETNFNNGIYGSSQNVIEMKQQNEMLKVMLFSSLIVNLAEILKEMNTVSIRDLQVYKQSFDKAYSFCILSDIIDADFRNELELCKIRFYSTYKNLLSKARDVYELNVEVATSLHQIVFSVNGNLDYFDETMKLNNIINTGFVSGKIFVVTK
jgi:hypothetical protein